MENKYKIGLGVLALAVSFAAGRYTVPTSVKNSSETSVVDNKKEKKSENESSEKHTKTTIVDITNPDGSKTHTVTKTTDEDKNKKSTDVSSDNSATTKKESSEVTRSGSRLTVSALAGTKLTFSAQNIELDYGAMVSRDLIGPISIGLFGFKSGIAGVSVGLSF